MPDMQLITAYVVYEIVGSAFKHCAADRRFDIEISRLHSNFAEFNVDKQVRRETDVENFVRSKLGDAYEALADYRCEVFFNHRDENRYEIGFYNGIDDLVFTIDKSGRIELAENPNRGNAWEDEDGRNAGDEAGPAGENENGDSPEPAGEDRPDEQAEEG